MSRSRSPANRQKHLSHPNTVDLFLEDMSPDTVELLIIQTIDPEEWKENLPKCWVCERSFLREVGKRLPRKTGCPHLMCGSHQCLNRAHCQWLDIKKEFAELDKLEEQFTDKLKDASR